MNNFNKDYEILTPSGFKSFDGIAKYPSEIGITLYLSNGSTFNCAKRHRIVTNIGVVEAKDSLNLIVSGDIFVYKIIENTKPEEYYDVLEVDTHLYVTGNIVSHNCEFQGSISTLIDAKYIKCITTRKPNLILDNRRFRIYSEALAERVLLDNGWQYIVTVDPAMGEKKDYTVAQVWLVKSNTDIEQVAVYESNDVDPHNFSNKLIGISKRYNTPGILVETQEVGGGAIVENLFYTKNYPMLINLQDEGIGFRLSHNRKIEACAYLQVYMKKGLLKLCDDRTRFQLSMFGRKGNTYKALGDGNDDLVTSILSVLYYVNSDYYYGNRDNNSPFEKKDLIPDMNSDFENDTLMIDELHKLEDEITHRSAYVPTIYMSDMFKYAPNNNIEVYKTHA